VALVVGASMAASGMTARAAPPAVQVPASATLTATLVTASAASPAAHGASTPVRVRNPAEYAQAKAAADRGYAAWAAAHSLSSASPSVVTTVGLNKPGLTGAQSGGGTPPDTTGAIGPSSYLEFVNSVLAVYSRTTLASPPIASATEDAFTGSTGTCDGQIKWDSAAQRFAYYSLDCQSGAGSHGFSFGWSKTASPTPLSGTTSNWCRFHVVTGSLLEDYGKLGNSNSFLIIGANEFSDTPGGYTDSPIFVVPKPANKVTTCATTLTIQKFTPAAASEFTPEPANVFGSSANGYIAAVSGTVNNALRMYTVSGTTTPVLTDNGNVTVPAFSVPASVPQPGTTDQLDSSDTRLSQANAAFDPALKAFAVWTQHTIAGPSNGPSVVRWYELKAGQATPVQTGTIAVAGAFAFNGAIAPTAAGNAAAINYDVGSSSLKVSVRAQIHPFGSASGSMASGATLTTSTGVDNDFSCPSQLSGSATCRWGDYAGASTDPAGCGNSVWGTNEFNGTPDGFGSPLWATQNFSLVVDECPAAAFTVTTASPKHGVPVGFHSSTTGDPDGSIIQYTWNFGDGTVVTTTSPTTTHTYVAAGTKSVTLTVRDAANLTNAVTHSVVVS
jgi:hypothetical protein